MLLQHLNEYLNAVIPEYLNAAKLESSAYYSQAGYRVDDNDDIAMLHTHRAGSSWMCVTCMLFVH